MISFGLNSLPWAVASDVGKCPNAPSPSPPNNEAEGKPGWPMRNAPGRWARWAAYGRANGDIPGNVWIKTLHIIRNK